MQKEVHISYLHFLLYKHEDDSDQGQSSAGLQLGGAAEVGGLHQQTVDSVVAVEQYQTDALLLVAVANSHQLYVRLQSHCNLS